MIDPIPVRAVRDVSGLPDVTFGNRSLAWWGTLWLMVIEAGTLVICATAYLYLRKNFYDYPPRGTALPSLGVPVTQLLVMAASLVPMALAARAAKRIDLESARLWLTLELVFKAAILVLRWYEFKALNVWWNSNAYGSAAWVIVNPSWHTSTGSETSGCSAMRGAMTVRSYASWAFSANSCTTPESRMSIESEWSQWMLIGPESARFPTAIVSGARIDAAI